MNISAWKNRIKMAKANEQNTQKGLVFIPDISGFTELVRSTDLTTGRIITRELLSTLIQNNILKMEIAEIEGDAIFFFKWKSIPAADELYEQFEIMKSAFDKKITELQARYKLRLNLHLKAIAHYGEMTKFSLKGFHKLYGEVVVEAHRLLKNSVPGSSYLLITDELMAASTQPVTNNFSPVGHPVSLCEIYDGLRSLCFTYILFEYLQPATPQLL